MYVYNIIYKLNYFNNSYKNIRQQNKGTLLLKFIL